jgi:hypothetical protein
MKKENDIGAVENNIIRWRNEITRKGNESTVNRA